MSDNKRVRRTQEEIIAAKKRELALMQYKVDFKNAVKTFLTNPSQVSRDLLASTAKEYSEAAINPNLGVSGE